MKAVWIALLFLLVGCGTTVSVPGVSVHIPGPYEVVSPDYGDKDGYGSKDHDRYERDDHRGDKDHD